ncbi:MAG: 30S ribosome-binding factor RbfA [Erysipelotrichaceae bacterium]|nr:30S ribosome-binding factor RbfA [Erysipelotrichaceae bacterium]
MAKVKTERLNATIQRELSMIFRNQVKDPQVKDCTITEVSCSNDYSYAKVYVVFHEHPKRGLEALERSKGYIRSQLAKRLTIRKCPELLFMRDESFEYGNHIEEIIRGLNIQHDEEE